MNRWVEITFVGTKGRLSTRQITYKTFLLRRVGSLFREQLTLDDLPEGELRDQIRSVPVQALYARNGWLTVGVNVPDQLLEQAGIGAP